VHGFLVLVFFHRRANKRILFLFEIGLRTVSIFFFLILGLDFKVVCRWSFVYFCVAWKVFSIKGVDNYESLFLALSLFGPVLPFLSLGHRQPCRCMKGCRVPSLVFF